MTFDFWIIKHADQYLRFVKIFFIMYPKSSALIAIIQVHNLGFKSIQFDPFILFAPNINGLPCSRNKSFLWLWMLFSVNISKAPSLKMLQFW